MSRRVRVNVWDAINLIAWGAPSSSVSGPTGNEEDDHPSLSQARWMNLRRFRNLKDCGATRIVGTAAAIVTGKPLTETRSTNRTDASPV